MTVSKQLVSAHEIRVLKSLMLFCCFFAEDIAVDWINDKLYWTDAVHARIEVMDLDYGYRRELLRTGPNTVPRAIAVDPSTRQV